MLYRIFYEKKLTLVRKNCLGFPRMLPNDFQPTEISSYYIHVGRVFRLNFDSEFPLENVLNVQSAALDVESPISGRKLPFAVKLVHNGRLNIGDA